MDKTLSFDKSFAHSGGLTEMLAFVYLLATTGATGNAEPQIIPVPPPAPIVYASPAPPTAMQNPQRVLVGKEKEATPLNSPGEWVTTDDYPATALAEERTGTTAFRLQIDKTGSVANCDVTISSGHVDLDTATCAYITQRAKFSPALDRKGRTTADDYANRVRWQIPEDDLFPGFAILTDIFPRGPELVDYDQIRITEADYPANAKALLQAGETIFQLSVASNGAVDKCDIVSTSGFIDLDNQSCMIAKNWTFRPALDFDGRPTRSRITNTFNWELPKNDALGNTGNSAAQTNPFETEGTVGLTIDVDEVGKVANCSVEQTGQLSFLPQRPKLTNEFCKIVVEAKLKPFSDTNGQLVSKRVVVKFSIEHEDVSTAKSETSE